MELTTIKRISKAGHSLGIYLTKELAIMGLKDGDTVCITIKRVDE